MDINKWKSVAIKKKDYNLLQGLCKEKFRAPGAMISKLLNDYLEHKAKKENTTKGAIEKKLLNGTDKKN